MARSKLVFKVLLLRIIYNIICWIVTLFGNKKSLINLKITLGTLILTLSSPSLYAQENKKIYNDTLYLNNDTLKLDVTLKENIVELNQVVRMCYYGQAKKEEILITSFLEKNLQYPESMREKSISGFVNAQYTVDKNYNIKDIKVTSGINSDFNNEVIRVIRLIPQNLIKSNSFYVNKTFLLEVLFEPNFIRVRNTY